MPRHMPPIAFLAVAVCTRADLADEGSSLTFARDPSEPYRGNCLPRGWDDEICHGPLPRQVWLLSAGKPPTFTSKGRFFLM